MTSSISKHFLQCETFSVSDVKHLNSFIHSIILASFYRQTVKINDSILSEMFIYMINDAITGNSNDIVTFENEPISNRGSNVSTSTNSFNAKVSKLGHHLLPVNVTVMYSDDVVKDINVLRIQPGFKIVGRS